MQPFVSGFFYLAIMFLNFTHVVAGTNLSLLIVGEYLVRDRAHSAQPFTH